MQLLDVLAHHPSTANFICRKLAQRFISDDPPPELVAKLARTFVDNNGDIRGGNADADQLERVLER